MRGGAERLKSRPHHMAAPHGRNGCGISTVNWQKTGKSLTIAVHKQIQRGNTHKFPQLVMFFGKD